MNGKKVVIDGSSESRQKLFEQVDKLADSWNETRTKVIVKALEELVEVHGEEKNFTNINLRIDEFRELSEKTGIEVSTIVSKAIKLYLLLNEGREILVGGNWVSKARETAKNNDLPIEAVISLGLDCFERKESRSDS